MNRVALIERETKETAIEVWLDLDGSGKVDVNCDDQFLTHMLESLAKYADFDLTVKAKGDNEHHILEDVAIVLGMALREAIGEQPIQRIASSMVPMDDALVVVALDLIDRPYVDIECPDPLYHHFLRSVAMSSGMTLHVKVVRGFDDHHVVEATIKALGRALRKAVAKRERTLSTKAKPKVRKK
ncbi:MAG: imidazoleglycerol-phosphate dehydratase [Methanomassiliicoccales archaeon]|nr:imidazoleglycerol-phosphate dehydratase [Methanomassiliicoccales archaeon]MDD1756210.1 imidazoleglycerol-phosphate dehydratase [Methanomassiliicoccales archaeon]